MECSCFSETMELTMNEQHAPCARKSTVFIIGNEMRFR